MTNHPSRAVTYTVLNRHGTVQDVGLSLSEAARTVLTYDDHEFEIRPEDGGFALWVSRASRSSSGGTGGMTRSVIWSGKADKVLATADINREVIRCADWWQGCEVLTDEAFQARLKEIE